MTETKSKKILSLLKARQRTAWKIILNHPCNKEEEERASQFYSEITKVIAVLEAIEPESWEWVTEEEQLKDVEKTFDVIKEIDGTFCEVWYVMSEAQDWWAVFVPSIDVI